MPRPPRCVEPGQPLHIMQRGNNRCITFGSYEDYAVYLRLLGLAARGARCEIHAFVLMTNHLHLLATPAEADGAALMMKFVSESYVRYYNEKRERTGTLWEGRYRSTAIDSANYFFACSRYIELNPVRAGMVPHPRAYRWSSFAQNAGRAPKSLVTPHQLYTALGNSESRRRDAYRGMFDAPLGQRTLESIRYLTVHRPKRGSSSWVGKRDDSARQLLRGV